MFDILIEGAAIVTMDPGRPVIPCGYVGIHDGKIAETGDFPSDENKTARLHIDGRG